MKATLTEAIAIADAEAARETSAAEWHLDTLIDDLDGTGTAYALIGAAAGCIDAKARADRWRAIGDVLRGAQ